MLEVSLHMSIAYSTRAFQSGYPQCRHLERRLPVSGLEWGASCHPERSEGSLPTASQILRCAQDDRHSLQTSAMNLVCKPGSSPLCSLLFKRIYCGILALTPGV